MWRVLCWDDTSIAECGTDLGWELTGPRGEDSVRVAPVVTADHLGFVVEATVAGLGIALLPSFIASAHVAAGALVQVLPRYTATVQLQLLTHATRRLPHRVALLRDFLAEHISGGVQRARRARAELSGERQPSGA